MPSSWISFADTSLNRINIHCKLVFYEYPSQTICLKMHQQKERAKNLNFHTEADLFICHHILMPVNIVPCLVHCKIVFSILKTHRAWHSGVSLHGLYNCNCDQHFLNRWEVPVKKVYFCLIPRHYVPFSVPVDTNCLESRNIRLVNNVLYNEFKM